MFYFGKCVLFFIFLNAVGKNGSFCWGKILAQRRKVKKSTQRKKKAERAVFFAFAFFMRPDKKHRKNWIPFFVSPLPLNHITAAGERTKKNRSQHRPPPGGGSAAQKKKSFVLSFFFSAKKKKQKATAAKEKEAGKRQGGKKVDVGGTIIVKKKVSKSET